MEEITVKSFIEKVNNGVYEVKSMDGYGIYINMVHVQFAYDETMNELTLLNVEGDSVVAEVSFNVEDSISCINIDDEEQDRFIIEFSLPISDLEIRKAVWLW